MNIEINREIAAKVLSVVDAGLVRGVGKPMPGQMCVEAAVCFALGLPHDDDPQCVSPALRSLNIRLNDQNWSSNDARAKGLRRLALAQLGSAGILDDREFATRVAEMTIRKMVPIALRAAASIQKNAAHRQKLLDAANHCEVEGTSKAALEARTAAADASTATYAYDAAADAYASASTATYAYADASTAAAADAAAAYAAAYADAYASTAAAADAAAYAAAYADAYAYAARRDEILSEFAEGVVQILIGMDAPGCQWLNLTEAAA